MIRRGWGVGAAALAVAVMVVGCNGDPEQVVTPTPTPTETASQSPSPSPTPSPSATALTEEEILAAIPEAARSEDFQGAQEFARFFLVESQEMVRRQDTSLFEAMSSPDCIFCDNRSEVADRHIAERLELAGAVLTIESELAQGSCSTATTCHVEFDIDIGSGAIIDATGEEVDSLEPEQLRVAVETSFVGSHWVVTGVGSEGR